MVTDSMNPLAFLNASIPYFKGRGRIVDAAVAVCGYSNREFIASFKSRGRFVRFYADMNSGIERSTVQAGSYEPEEARIIERSVSGGDHVLDIGANVGLHALRLANIIGPSGRLFCYEPNMETRARLLRNLALNGFSNVLVSSDAVGEYAGLGTLYVNSVNDGNRNATMVAEEDASRNPIAVKIVRLDDIEFQGRISFIKLDIEGFEYLAIKGAKSLLRDHKPVVMLEYNKHFAAMVGWKVEDLTSVFSSVGTYRCRTAAGHIMHGEPDSVMTTLVFSCSSSA